MLSAHHVTCRQTERPLITLGSATPFLKEESPSRNRSHYWIEQYRAWQTERMVLPFSAEGKAVWADSQWCWGRLGETGHDGRWGVLLWVCGVLKWHLAGEIQEAAGLHWWRARETLKWERWIWGPSLTSCHIIEPLWGRYLRGRFQGLTGRFCFWLRAGNVHLEKEPQSTLWETLLQSDRWNQREEV